MCSLISVFYELSKRRVVKNYKATLFLLFLSSVPASAADLPSIKSAPLSAPIPMWTGFYAGLNSGGTWASNNNVHITQTPAWFNPLNLSVQSASSSEAAMAAGSSISVPMQNNANFIGGMQIGYNEKIIDRAIVGIETDFQGVVNSGGIATTVFEPFAFSSYSQNLGTIITKSIYNQYSASKNLSYFGTVRGRFGFLANPEVLLYLTAGLACGSVNSGAFGAQALLGGDTNEIGPGKCQYSGARLGWTAGGGAEWMFMENWSAKVEYLYYSLNPVSLYMGQGLRFRTLGGNGLSAGDLAMTSIFSARTYFSGNIVRAGVNYHFNFNAAPVVAKF